MAIKTINMENLIEMFSLANQFNAETLKEATKSYIVENKKMIGQQDFCQVSQSIVVELLKLLSQL